MTLVISQQLKTLQLNLTLSNDRWQHFTTASANACLQHNSQWCGAAVTVTARLMSNDVIPRAHGASSNAHSSSDTYQATLSISCNAYRFVMGSRRVGVLYHYNLDACSLLQTQPILTVAGIVHPTAYHYHCLTSTTSKMTPNCTI